ncbi:MAG: hypothetical protein SFX18_13975 [Pirellulales bacterium]|nr:hypothetical protein [Pirellulales bacterium]
MTELFICGRRGGGGGFIARAIGPFLVTEAVNLEELRANVREAVECHFEEGGAPQLLRLHFVRDELMAL